MLVQFRADHAQTAGDASGTPADFLLPWYIVEVEPTAVVTGDDTFGPEDNPILNRIAQGVEGVFDLLLAVPPRCLGPPTGKDLISIMVMAARAVMTMMMVVLMPVMGMVVMVVPLVIVSMMVVMLLMAVPVMVAVFPMVVLMVVFMALVVMFMVMVMAMLAMVVVVVMSLVAMVVVMAMLLIMGSLLLCQPGQLVLEGVLILHGLQDGRAL